MLQRDHDHNFILLECSSCAFLTQLNKNQKTLRTNDKLHFINSMPLSSFPKLSVNRPLSTGQLGMLKKKKKISSVEVFRQYSWNFMLMLNSVFYIMGP